MYGGVRDDLEGLSGIGWSDGYALLYDIVIAPFFAVDLPFSLIGDTVTLPYTVAYALLGPHPIPPAPAKRTKGPKPFQPAPANAPSSSAAASPESQLLSSRIDLLLGFPNR
jgi:hypothetical protein